MSLGEALPSSTRNETNQGGAGRMRCTGLHSYKRDEWEKVHGHVTDWDLRQYWDYLPFDGARLQTGEREEIMCGMRGLILFAAER